MASVNSRLSALCAKIEGLFEPETDMTLRRVSMACIFIAMHDLGNAALPSSRSTTTRTRSKPIAPISTSTFVFFNTLAQGGSADVTRVQHRTTGKAFVMKTLFQDNELEVDIFNLGVLREACFMAACRGHPSLVRLHAVCRDPITERYCLAMDHVGPSLCEVLHQCRHGEPFQEYEVRRMIRQVLSGAKAMHDRGIVHRNINSENVLVDAGGDIVKIGGFGQAACTSEMDVPGRSAIWYSAPELFLLGRGASESALIDSFSIGCLMAELLTGTMLFGVNDLENMAEAQLHRIFHVLGIPGKRAMQDMKPQELDLAAEVRKWRTRRGVGKLRSDNRLRKLVPPKVLSEEGVGVLL